MSQKELLTLIVYVGTTERKNVLIRFNEHIRNGRFSTNEHEILIFKTIDLNSPNPIFENPFDESIAYELALTFVRIDSFLSMF